MRFWKCEKDIEIKEMRKLTHKVVTTMAKKPTTILQIKITVFPSKTSIPLSQNHIFRLIEESQNNFMFHI